MSELSPEMAELLGTLKSEGRMDSSGIFTLDIRKALPKLRDYQLPQPHFYIPKLVMTAVASRATFVDVKINEYRVAIEFDGEPFTTTQMQNILDYLFQEDPRNRRLRHLATAINTAVGLEAREVQLDSGLGRDAARQKWLAHDRNVVRKLEKPWGSDQVRTRFLLWRSLSDISAKWWHTAGKADIWDLLTAHDRALTPEQAELKGRVLFCPIPVTLNGRKLNNPTFGEPHRKGGMLSGLYGGSDSYRGVNYRHNLIEWYVEVDGSSQSLAAPRSHASIHVDKKLTAAEAPGPALLALQMGRRRAEFQKGEGGKARVVFVLDGVILGGREYDSKVFGGYAVVSAEGLPLDFSQFRVNDSEALAKRYAWLDQMFAQMQQELADRAREIPHIKSDVLRDRLEW
ncbi:MAG: hypothetical protein AB1758_27340 [Candidatus Eremiobacterota bacterium]